MSYDFFANNKTVCVLNATKNKVLSVQNLSINISNLNFQSENSFSLDVDDFSEIADRDLIEILKREGENAGEWEIVEGEDYVGRFLAEFERRVFTAYPYAPYDVGDLWLDSGSLKRCIASNLSGSYDAEHWETEENDILSGTPYAHIMLQNDGVIRAWNREADPSASWTTEEDKLAHDGDLWYRPSQKVTRRYRKTWKKVFSGIARVQSRKTDRLENKSVDVVIEFPMLTKREFKKVVINDEHFLGKWASNPAAPADSVLHIIADRLGFPLAKTRFDEARSYYNAGMSQTAEVPFTLFQKGDRWVDELTTLVDAVSGYLFINQDFDIVYRSYVDAKFKEKVKDFELSEIYQILPYKYSPGTNNGTKIEFDRFEMDTEAREVFKAEKKAYARVGEKLNLKFKYITDIVVDPVVKSCEVYYYVDEKPVYITDYSKYVTFNLTVNNGEIVVNNTFSKDIYVDNIVIEARALVRYADNSTILKDKTVTEELQEDFLTLSKNKYIQNFYAARSKAVKEYYSKVRDTHSVDITIAFSPEYELGDKVGLEGNDYCIDEISHTFDHRTGYRTKLSLIQVLDPDFLNIAWKETETVNAEAPGLDLDLVNSLIDDKIEQTSQNVLNAANRYTEESKQQLEQQLAEDVKKLEGLDKVIQDSLDAEKERIDAVTADLTAEKERVEAIAEELREEKEKIETIASDLEDERDRLEQLGKDLVDAETGLRTEITTERDRITLAVQEIGRVENITTQNATSISNNAKEIALKASQTFVDSLTDRVSSAESSITVNAEQIALKATQTDLDAAEQRISTAEAEITVQAGEIALKASEASVNNLTDRVSTAESAITANAGQISLKASQKELDETGKRISAAEAGITVNSEEIALKASKTSLDDLTDRVSNAETSITATAEQIALKASQTDLDEATQRISAAETGITVNAGEIALKASQSSLDEVTGRVSAAESQLTVQAGEIATKVSSTTYEGDRETDNTRMTNAETRIKQTEDKLLLVATESTVEQLAGRVSTAEAAIELNTTNISLKASQSDVNNLTGRVSSAEAAINIESDRITQEVTNRQTAVNDLEKKVTQNTTAITQTSDSIGLMAESIENHDDLLHSGEHLISQINLSPGHVYIDSSNIVIGSTPLTNKVSEIDTTAKNASSTASAAQEAVTGVTGSVNQAISDASAAKQSAIQALNKTDELYQGKFTINANTTMNGIVEVFGGDYGIISYDGTTVSNSRKRIIIKGGEILFQEWID